jgi:hypothetical protein
MSISAKDASDCLVAVFFLCHVDGARVSYEMRRLAGETGLGLPFLATIFHAVGLKVMSPSERKRDVLEASRRAVRDMIAMLWQRPAAPANIYDAGGDSETPQVTRHCGNHHDLNNTLTNEQM